MLSFYRRENIQKYNPERAAAFRVFFIAREIVSLLCNKNAPRGPHCGGQKTFDLSGDPLGKPDDQRLQSDLIADTAGFDLFFHLDAGGDAVL